MAAADPPVTVQSTMMLPEFQRKLLNPERTPNRATSGELNIALYSIHATLTGMCGSKMPTMKKHDCWIEAKQVCVKLMSAFQQKYPEAAVSEYIGHTSTTKITGMDGEKIWRM